MPAPDPAERDRLFRTFGRAWFKRDLDLLYEVVTPDFEWRSVDRTGTARLIKSRAGISEVFAAQAASKDRVGFSDVVYHHAPEASFMTFRLTETEAATNTVHEQLGIERYTFRDGRIATKDVYRKQA